MTIKRVKEADGRVTMKLVKPDLNAAMTDLAEKQTSPKPESLSEIPMKPLPPKDTTLMP